MDQMPNRALTVLCAAAVSCGALGCGRSEKKLADNSAPLRTLVAATVTADLSRPDPNADYWNDVVGGTVTLMAQPMINPRPATTTTDKVEVQAVHDSTRIAFRMRWKDTEKSESGRLGEFSDAFALEFPQKSDGAVPPVMMGAPGMPVQLYHWRAQYQRDEEQGKPTMEQLYPNKSTDMYMHEYKTAPLNSPDAAEKYSPAKAVRNPQSFQKKAVDVILAEGFATSAVQENDGATAKAEWKDGTWTLVISRPLASPAGSVLKAGTPGNVAFAVWQGGHNEVGSRKSVIMQWTPLQLQ